MSFDAVLNFAKEKLGRELTADEQTSLTSVYNATPACACGGTCPKCNPKAGFIGKLTANSMWSGQEAFLGTLNEEQLTALVTKLPVTNADDTPDEEDDDEEDDDDSMTENWLATAPKKVQSVVRNSMKEQDNKKVAIIADLTANLEGAEKTIVLNRLTGLSYDALVDLKLLHKPAPVYTGAGGGAPGGISAVPVVNTKSELLIAPKMTFPPLPSPSKGNK